MVGLADCGCGKERGSPVAGLRLMAVSRDRSRGSGSGSGDGSNDALMTEHKNKYTLLYNNFSY